MRSLNSTATTTTTSSPNNNLCIIQTNNKSPLINTIKTTPILQSNSFGTIIQKDLPQQQLTTTIGLIQSNDDLIDAQQQQQNQQQKNPKLYKTELCRSWGDTGRCNYGERLIF